MRRETPFMTVARDTGRVMSEENVEVVRRTLKAFSDRDFDAASYLEKAEALEAVGLRE
jgi:hypothetical protein